MSNGDGKYRLDQIGPANYHHNVMIGQYDSEKYEIIYESFYSNPNNLPESAFPALAFRYVNDNWQSIKTYPPIYSQTASPLKLQQGSTSTTRLFFTGREFPGQSLRYMKIENGQWTIKSSIKYLPSGDVNKILWNGSKVLDIYYLINGEKFFDFSFPESCVLSKSPGGSEILVVLMQTKKLPIDYVSTLIDERLYANYQPLLAYDLSNDVLSQLTNFIIGDTPSFNGFNFSCADHNGDGYDDIVMSRDGLKPLILINNRQGQLVSFESPGIPLPTIPGNPRAIQSKFGDFDGDGIGDLMYFSNGPVDSQGTTTPMHIILYRGLKNLNLE
jgi:hypothetical protein